MPQTMLEIERAKRVGGRLCLDFVNTVRGRTATPATGTGQDYAEVLGERLVSYEALLRWSRLAGALTDPEERALARQGSARPAPAAAVLKRGLALRETMFGIFKAVIEQRRPDPQDLSTLNRELRVARAHEQLAAAPHFAWRWEAGPSELDRVLWPVARSAADLLIAPELARVRQCPGEECGWLFLDLSRSGRRQWCDMADCGNLAKVRRFRERRATR